MSSNVNPKKFIQYFGNSLEEVFLYILDACNYKCVHCYMGEARKNILTLEEIQSILSLTHKMGAKTLTILGGEPTLHKQIFDIISYAKEIGFDTVILDSNGNFPAHFFDNPDFKKTDIFSFSLDSHDNKGHDAIRRNNGAFDRVVQKIGMAKKGGHRIRVTCTVSSVNEKSITRFLDFVDGLGVDILNFHLITNNGFAQDNQSLLIEPKSWLDVYSRILGHYNRTKHKYKLSIPPRYCDPKQFKGIKNEHTCLSACKKRILIYPDKKVYTCSILGHSANYIAIFENDSFIWNKDYIERAKSLNSCDPKTRRIGCPEMNISSSPNFVHDKHGLVPLCISYKPSVSQLC